MFQKILRPDSPLMVTMTQITDCVFLSLFWILGCFPVVTAGASSAALYDAVVQGYRRGDKHPWQRFFRSFRRNLLPGLVPTIVYLVVFWLLWKGLVGVWNGAVYGEISWMVFSGVAFLAVTVLGILSVLFPMLSRFENATGVLLKNTLLVAMANLPRTIALGMLHAMSVVLCLRYIYPLFFLPGLYALVSTLLIEPMFRPYMPKD